MPAASVSELAHHQGLLRDVCQAIPAFYLVDHDLSGAAAALSEVVVITVAAGLAAVPVSASNPEPDMMATLWFIRAAHLLGWAAAPGSEEAALFATTLLPLAKKLLQGFIIDQGIGGVRMDDGGLLIPPASFEQVVRLNALWYSALETTAADLKAANDPVADHFERLAGRFRRSFAKAYWCDGHGCICPPAARVTTDHGALPEADQLLLTCLPVSPIPRTKQRQLLQRLHTTALGAIGVRVAHGTHAIVESPMHLAWLARGWYASADPPASGLAEAAAMLQPLQALVPAAHAAGGGIAAYYLLGQPLAGEGPSFITKAEVLAAIKMLK